MSSPHGRRKPGSKDLLALLVASSASSQSAEDCIELELLVGFAEKKLLVEEQQVVLDHVASCLRCSGLLAMAIREHSEARAMDAPSGAQFDAGPPRKADAG